ncbi:hypothetical protein ES288_A06G051000v1 [Gossypium darwinii]|uniref:Uncharacterized protein n=1 Tax=Gossypium darwinii TaxID=34276 RepID=A0A5D2G3T7_GOSDA|nr:hypothetical protein ES288_A06G051000v1 [Gossypium darwinii]
MFLFYRRTMMGSRIKISTLGVIMLLLLIAPASNTAISCSVVIKDLRLKPQVLSST